VGPINPIAHQIGNHYILVIIDYAMKWIKAKAFTNNTLIANTRFLYEHIITKFDCPLKLINNQGGHIINETIEILITKFMINHKKATTYGKGNGQAESNQHGVGGHFMEVNQFQSHKLGCKAADHLMGLSKFLED
jgi:hypothetical protein